MLAAPRKPEGLPHKPEGQPGMLEGLLPGMLERAEEKMVVF